MKVIIATVVAFGFLGGLIGSQTHAADLGKPAAPATFEQILAMRDKQPLTGCYAETSVAGTYLRAGDRNAQGGIGGGCDIIVSGITMGTGIRADWGDVTTGSVFAKLGIAVNANLALYGIAELRSLDWKIKDSGQLQLGAGVETSLSIISPSLSAFLEGTTSVSKFGPTATKDDVLIRLGARVRF